jgi:uncharacterized protein YukE
MSNIIHMETELVRDEGRKMMYTATDFIDLMDQLRYSAGNLRQAWNGPRATNYMHELDRLITSLRTQAQNLDTLGSRITREVDEWVDADRIESEYVSAVKNSFSVSGKEVATLFSAAALASTLRWSSLRPNSIIFSGPNWMRKAVGIKEMTRVIRPATLAKGMAVAGLAISAWDAYGVIQEDLANSRYEDVSRTVSAATVDGGFRFALSAIGTAVIPLALGTIVAAVGLPVVAGGAVVLAGSVLLGFGYSKLVEAPVWEMWKNSTARDEIIEKGARVINQVNNCVNDLKQKTVERVRGAFGSFINAITASPSPATT